MNVGLINWKKLYTVVTFKCIILHHDWWGLLFLTHGVTGPAKRENTCLLFTSRDACAKSWKLIYFSQILIFLVSFLSRMLDLLVEQPKATLGFHKPINGKNLVWGVENTCPIMHGTSERDCREVWDPTKYLGGTVDGGQFRLFNFHPFSNERVRGHRMSSKRSHDDTKLSTLACFGFRD